MSYIFVASPYSHPDKDVANDRYHETMRFCAWAFGHGLVVFSPIVHWHRVAQYHDLPADASTWKSNSKEMIDSAYAVYVLCIDGWQESKGILNEVMMAAAAKMSIKWVHPTDDGEWEIM